ncbi:MAG: hypothetical protein ACETWT_02050 [Thermodesulfobacteriota bacterium]
MAYQVRMKGNVCGDRKALIFGGRDIVIDNSSPRGYFNFIERGNNRREIELGLEGILVLEDYR